MSIERIRKLRSMMLIHSYVYYHRNDSLVSDDQWQAWAEELAVLQGNTPCSIGWYDEAFKDWDGTTGMHLPRDSWVENKARQLLKYRDEHENS